jgi:hypothetical protein
MNITPYINKINADAAVITQAVAATRGVSQTGVSTAAELVTALASVLGDRIYNLELPQDVTYPAAVFGQEGSTPVLVDGYHTMQVDTYLLSVVASTIDGTGGLIESVDAVRDALEASSWSMEVVDSGTSYDDETLTYATTMEVEVSIPVLTTQTLPAAIVYPLDVSADESRYTNLTKQRVTQSIGITLITDSTETISDVRDDLFAALLGYQVDDTYSPVEYRSGSAVEGGGKLTVWREIFFDAYYIQES